MNVSDINSRRDKIKYRSNKPLASMYLSESYVPKQLEVCKNLLQNWSSLNNDKKLAFTEALRVANKYVERHPNDEKYITDYFVNEVVQSYPNLKEIDHIIKKSNRGINIADKYSKLDTFIVSDRILKNQANLDKKCDISNYLKENKNTLTDKEDITMCIEYMADLINESYNTSSAIKYNVALENIYYMVGDTLGLTKKDILEAVTDYFYTQDIVPFNEQIKDKVLSQNILYEKVDLSKKIKKRADMTLESIRNIPKKTPDVIKKFITRLYTNKSVNNIIDETPNILGWIRKGITFSTLALSLWIGLIVILTDRFIAMTVTRKEVGKMLDKYKKEVEKAKKQRDKATNPKQKERLDKYVKELESNLDKIKDYEESLYSEKELDARYDEDDDDDFSFDESTDILDYLDHTHESIIDHAIHVSIILSNKVNSTYPFLKDDVIKLVSQDEIRSYAEMNDDDIDSIIGLDSNISIPLAYVLSNEKYNGERLEDIINIICKLTNESIKYQTHEYCISFDGNDDMYTIYVDYKTTLCRDNNLIKESTQIDICRKFSYMQILENELERFNINMDILEEANLENILSEGDNTSILALESMALNYGVINRNRLHTAINNTLRYSNLNEAVFNSYDTTDELVTEGLGTDIRIQKEKLYNEMYVKKIIKEAQSGPNPFKKLYNILHTILAIPVITAGTVVMVSGIIVFVVAACITAATASRSSETKLKKLKKIIQRKLEEANACIRNGKDVEVMKVRKKELSTSLEMINKELDRITKKNKKNAKKIDKVKDEISSRLEGADILDNYSLKSTLSTMYYTLGECNLNVSDNLYDVINYLYEANTLIESFISYENQKYEAIDEKTSIKSNVKLAANKVKNSLKRANDKQNELSKRLDDSVEKLTTDAHKKLANNNRERVIKGSIIPSASRIFKAALGTGVLALVNPALAVVGLLGGIALSKRATKKERQYILDEIEIQLNIVDKKIQLAESNNDMRSLEQLLKIQKKLKREEQRIKYKMRAVYPVSVSD